LSVSVETKKRLRAWSEKVGSTLEQLMDDLLELKTNLKDAQPDLTDEVAEQRARFLLYRKLSTAIRSPAVPFRGVVVAVSPVRDMAEVARNIAIAEFQRDKESAIARGLVTPDGVPLDTREYLIPPSETTPGRKNPNYGKPLKPFPVKSVILVGRLLSEKKLKLIHILLRGGQAGIEVPEPGQVVDFRANIRRDTANLYALTSSTSTVFQPAKDPELSKLDFDYVFEGAPEEFTATL